MKEIKLIVLDVDGVLTDGKITYTEKGDEIKNFNVKDGMAIKTWLNISNKNIVIITGRKSNITKRRADELGIKHIYQGIKNKDEELKKLLKELDLTYDNVASIGDDLNDYQVLEKSRISFTPKNGVKQVKKLVDITLTKKGGCGCVREMIEEIIEMEQLEKEYYGQFGLM